MTESSPEPAVRLDDLISYVASQHPGADPLQQLEDAVATSTYLGEVSDHLIGFFVDKARNSGATWTDIGQHMGVSKQAAQKRFVAKESEEIDYPKWGMFSRFTPRARKVVAVARDSAAEMGHDEVSNGTHPARADQRVRRSRGRAIVELGRPLIEVHAAVIGRLPEAEGEEQASDPVRPRPEEDARTRAARSPAFRPQLHRHRTHPARTAAHPLRPDGAVPGRHRSHRGSRAGLARRCPRGPDGPEGLAATRPTRAGRALPTPPFAFQSEGMTTAQQDPADERTDAALLDYGSKVVAVEPGGVEFIPLDERHGTPIQLFWTWTSPNMEFATIAVGILGVAVLRADVLAVGRWRSSSAPRWARSRQGVLSTWGPKHGLPQMVLSRSGVRLPRQHPAGRAQRDHRRHRLVRRQQRQRRAAPCTR